MKKIFVLLMVICLSLVSGGSSQQADLKSNDVTVETRIVPFISPLEYRSYFSLLDPNQPDSDFTELSQDTKQVIISWELNSEARVKYPDRLYYGPYIIVLPPENKWEYAGTTHISGESFIRSFRSEIITNVLKNYSGYNWNELSSLWVFHAKSFEQGTINVAFKRRTDSIDANEIFKVFFIYYDPTTKYGWVIEKSSKV